MQPVLRKRSGGLVRLAAQSRVRRSRWLFHLQRLPMHRSKEGGEHQSKERDGVRVRGVAERTGGVAHLGVLPRLATRVATQPGKQGGWVPGRPLYYPSPSKPQQFIPSALTHSHSFRPQPAVTEPPGRRFRTC